MELLHGGFQLPRSFGATGGLEPPSRIGATSRIEDTEGLKILKD